MKFIRPEQLRDLGVTKVVRAPVQEDTVKEVKEVVAEAPTPVVVEVPVVEEVKPVDVQRETKTLEELKKKFAIPDFNRAQLEPEKQKIQLGKFERVVEPPKVEEKIPAEVVKSIELVDEVPVEAEVKEGVEIVGDLAPEVQTQLDEIVEQPIVEEVAVDDLVDDSTVEVENEVDGKVDEEPIDEVSNEPDISVESEVEHQSESEVVEKDESGDMVGLSAEAWEKFVDGVVVPTLDTCVVHLKDYIVNVLAEELKKQK